MSGKRPRGSSFLIAQLAYFSVYFTYFHLVGAKGAPEAAANSARPSLAGLSRPLSSDGSLSPDILADISSECVKGRLPDSERTDASLGDQCVFEPSEPEESPHRRPVGSAKPPTKRVSKRKTAMSSSSEETGSDPDSSDSSYGLRVPLRTGFDASQVRISF